MAVNLGMLAQFARLWNQLQCEMLHRNGTLVNSGLETPS